MQEYIRYLTDVLGVRSAMMPPAEVVPLPARLIFLEETGFSSPESLDLLGKMREAMKMDAEEVLYLELHSTDIANQLPSFEQAQVIVVFSKNLADYLTANFPHWTVLQSPSPLEMLKNSALKREAWDVLKHAMQILA
jgi:hypothetical protein